MKNKKTIRRGLITEVINFLNNNEATAFNAEGYHTWVEDIIVGGRSCGSYYELFKKSLKNIKAGEFDENISYVELPSSGYTQYGTEIRMWSEMTKRGLLICIEVKQPYKDEEGWAYQELNKYFFM